MEINYTGGTPQYMSEGAAGADLSSNRVREILPNTQEMIDTGTSVEIPEGYFGIVTPRSSICNKRACV